MSALTLFYTLYLYYAAHLSSDPDDVEVDDEDGAISPTSRDIQEKIRKLNERLCIADKAMSQAPKDIRPAIDLSKYKIIRKWVLSLSMSVVVRHQCIAIAAVVWQILQKGLS